MAVHKYLDLSTAHLPYPEWQLVESLSEYLPRVIPHQYGAFVNVPQDPIEEVLPELKELTPVLSKLLSYAKDLDCLWINFDQDGEMDPNLESFEW